MTGPNPQAAGETTGSAPPAASGHAELSELAASGGGPPSRRRRRRRRLLAAAVAIAVLVGGGVYVEAANPDGVSFSHPLGYHPRVATGTRDNGAATSTQTVERRSLSQTTSVPGTLGYAGDYTVRGQAHGTITWLPAAGQVIREGKMLYQVDGTPVVLLYGSTPAYRALAEGATASDVTGHDVRQLNHDLVKLGYIRSSQLGSHSGDFTWATKLGLKRLQRALGVTATGKLTLGSYVFEPGPVRVTGLTADLGGQASGQVLTGSSTARQVTVALDAAQQSQVKAGDKVTITLPDNQTTPGTVTSVGKVATTPPSSNGQNGQNGSNSTPTITVQIAPADAKATGTLDQAPVQVAITTATVHNALVVPVAALLALSSGGYAVEVVSPAGSHHLVPVTPGLFDDASELVQVTGSGLAAGQHVVVPAS